MTFLKKADGQPFTILVSGRFRPHQVKVRWRPDATSTSARLRQAIDEYWKTEVAASGKQSFIFNGDLCQLQTFQVRGNDLVLNLARTDYKHLLYSNHIHANKKSNSAPEFCARALGISAIVTSSDNRTLLIRRSKRVGESPGRLDVLGGHVTPTEHTVEGIPDPFLGMREEISEEIDLHIETSELTCLGLVETAVTRKPELLFLHRSRLTAEAILRTASNHTSDEIAELLAIRNHETDLAAILQTRQNDFSPSAMGCLALYLTQMNQTG